MKLTNLRRKRAASNCQCGFFRKINAQMLDWPLLGFRLAAEPHHGLHAVTRDWGLEQGEVGHLCHGVDVVESEAGGVVGRDVFDVAAVLGA